MRLPNKITNYDDSVLSKFVPVLDELILADITPLALYQKTASHYNTIEDFVDALDCLCALSKIVYIQQKGVLHYVA